MKFRFSLASTRMLMVSSTLFLAILGLAGTFMPDEVLSRLGEPESDPLLLIVQIIGALYLGFAALNWMTRDSLVGGIYSRPVVIGNLMHFMIAGLAMIKILATTSLPTILWVIAIGYTLFGAAFGFVLMRHPVRSDARAVAPTRR